MELVIKLLLKHKEAGNKINLYVGGGITAKSDPLREWIETVSKTGTIKRVL